MNTHAIKQNRFVRNFVRDKWLILGAIGIILAFAAIYLAFFFKPVYTSEAKIWIKDLATESYITNAEATSQLKPLTIAGNPVLTQMQILESREMEQFLANYILQNDRTLLVQAPQSNTEGPLPSVEENQPKVKTKGILGAGMEPGTDIITVDLKWHDPVMAQQLLVAALGKYQDMNLGINRDIRTKKRAYIDERVREIEGKLVEIRNQLKDYQIGVMSVDVDEETKELIKLKAQLVARYEDVLATRSNASSNVSELQSQLRMNPQQALQAVALGSGNENLVKMRTELGELKRQYEHDAVKLAPTNPKMTALQNQISSLEKQILNEERLSSGNPGNSGARIYDHVRENLVEAMSTERAKLMGLSSEVNSLQQGIARINEQLSHIPESKYATENLKQEEKALALAYDELRKKQIEASILEAETPSNIFIVDAPSLPESASFPKAWHVLAMALMLGSMSGFGLSTVKTYMEDRCEGIEAIENALGAKVLGIIPWMHRPIEASRQNVLSMNDIAYKNIVSKLRLQAERQQARTITFTSSSLRKSRNSTLHTLARHLNRLGDSVAMVDADFRNPRLYKKNIFTKSATMELSDLILNINNQVRDGNFVHPQEVLSTIAQDQHGIHMAFNTQTVDDAYDYFASRGFRMLLDILRENFDWVLIDTPSASIAPEYILVSHKADGSVLFVEHEATYSKLRRISSRLKEAQIPLLGAIIRDQNSDFEKEHDEFTQWRGNWKNGKLIPGTSGPAAIVSKAGSTSMQRVEFMGAHIDPLSMQETLERIQEIIENGERVQHVVVNVAKLVMMQNDSELRDIVNNCELVNADGSGIVWGARMMGLDLPERITGTDLMENLIPLAAARGYRIFFFGAEEEVIRDVIAVYRRQYPDLKIAGFRNGYYAPYEEAGIAMEIRDARPDILFVGFSSPKKERFLAKYKDYMSVPFVMGVGGSFDVVAGKIKRAPLWMQDSGLEWFYRLMQEPRRMWKRYLVTNSVFGWMLMSNMISGMIKPRTN